MAETPSADENPGQVQDELRRVRLRPTGTRDPGPTQRQQHLVSHLNCGPASLQQQQRLHQADCGGCRFIQNRLNDCNIKSYIMK